MQPGGSQAALITPGFFLASSKRESEPSLKTLKTRKPPKRSAQQHTAMVATTGRACARFA